MANVLLEETSPFGNLQAFVEADSRTVYFYLWGGSESEFGTRSVWVRNLSAAPSGLDVAAMREGNPPLNPAAHCRETAAGLLPDQDRLRVVWLPEGNGTALLEGDELLAIIPPWSGEDGFHGYAAGARGEGPLAWGLENDNAMVGRVKAAQAYWSRWDDPSFWPQSQQAMMDCFEKALGEATNYYAIDNNQWPPKALLRFISPERTVLSTLGLSLLAQPNVERATADPAGLRRIELGAVLPSHWSDAAVMKMAAYLSGQSALPWRRFTWLGPGHTIPCDAWDSDAFDHALLSTTHQSTVDCRLPHQFGDPVSILWLIPITAQEREQAITSGSEALWSKLPTERWIVA